MHVKPIIPVYPPFTGETHPNRINTKEVANRRKAINITFLVAFVPDL